jgi:hypothetical protein
MQTIDESKFRKFTIRLRHEIELPGQKTRSDKIDRHADAVVVHSQGHLCGIVRSFPGNPEDILWMIVAGEWIEVQEDISARPKAVSSTP